ncbi:hypothetical protein NIES4071_87040 [Calothrix sp. NIES-4071]|nr:hypothetical protein NIES4071_87040 [Calothrix sp. NIES-4071]BAZ62971.1 hypothetical protein NIES4105_86970 [Calothrix sp. NIES-4105]
MKPTVYLTAKVLPGNKIELESSDLLEGQIVEVVIILPEARKDNSTENSDFLDLERRKAFLKLPISERRRIMEAQADKMLSHYQEDSEWQELMAGDIIDY